MTFWEASELSTGKPPRPDPACPKCAGAGQYPDPPLAEQEREAARGERRWMTRVACDCYRVED